MNISHQQIIEKFKAIPEVETVFVDGDGHHYQVTIISDLFNQQSKIQRQKWVYSVLHDWIRAGQLHAIEMKTWTKSEWEKQH